MGNNTTRGTIKTLYERQLVIPEIFRILDHILDFGWNWNAMRRVKPERNFIHFLHKLVHYLKKNIFISVKYIPYFKI